jgi:glycerophosphoryl diester phosphodiesterase
VGVIVELKYYGHDQRLEERVIELVEERDMASNVVIMSLKLAGVEKVQALRPDWTVGLLSAVAVGDLTRTDVDFLAVSRKLATPYFIRSAHQAGKDVYVWTVNDVIGISTQLSRGVDSLITDEPGLAREVIAQRAEMSSAERLLVELAALFGLTSDETLTEADA